MLHDIDEALIEYVGILAKLELDGEQKKQAGQDMEEMLSYFDRLAEADTENVRPLIHVHENRISGVLRKDEPVESAAAEKIVDGAVRQKDGMFVVPRSI